MKYKLRHIIKYFTAFSGILFLISSCAITKYVPEDEHLLTKVKINSNTENISKQELKSYVRQQENLKVLGFWKLYLRVYNLSGQNEHKKINRWLRKIGEEPIIFDSILVERSVSQLQLFLNNQGYYQAEVLDVIHYPTKKRVKVTYNINAGHRYRIKDVFYKIEDDSLKYLIMSDTANSVLKSGRGFSLNLHDRERERITRRLNNHGYYAFSKDFIYFNADSAHANYLVSDTVVVSKPISQTPKDSEHHSKYSIREVMFHVGGNPQDVIFEGIGNQFKDTIYYQAFKIVYNDKLDFKPSVLINSNYINPGELYRAELVERTQLLLSGLRIFKSINIRFREINGVYDKNGNKQIDCIIHLIQGDDISHAFDIEVTNSAGNFGAAGGFNFQHKNIFRGAELLSVSARIARQDQYVYKSEKLFNTLETGGETSIVFPKFLLPIRIEKFRQRYNPYTNMSVSYNYQRRPDYTRTIANARIGYLWRSSRTTSHNFSLFDLNFVNIPHISTDFKNMIDSTFLHNIYQNHFILNSNYTITYNRQPLGRNTSFWFVRYNIEIAGNLLNLVVPLVSKSQEDYYSMFGVRYAQYIKNEIDIRYNQRVNRLTSIIYRIFTGVAIPYGNLDVLPFSKRYFSGGAYSLRAWPVRGVGPGFVQNDFSKFDNQTADIKLEANVEYRFKLFWVLEGAFFLDAGNIWDIRKNNAREGGLFKFDEFYKQIALGTGFGTRFDFNFVLFRIDFGLKLYDPSELQGVRWRPFAGYTSNDFAFNFAIGYPF